MTHDLKQELKRRYGLDDVHDVDSIQPAVATLEAVGDPQEEFAAFHVAGTNGKGSTCRFIADILQHAGYDVGLYAGPAVGGYTDQFRINGESVTEQRVLELAERVAAAADPSMYELSTAIAFLLFAEEDIDVAAVEVGVGGRLDATNVLDGEVCAVTSIGRDHTDVLGESLPEIANEKAGIIWPGTSVVSNIDPELDPILRRRLGPSGDFYRVDDRVKLVETEGLTMEARYDGRTVPTSILARYQEQNINTALTALAASRFSYTSDDVITALQEFSYPGRMEMLQDDPVTIVDGAHNVQGMQTLLEELDRLEEPVAVFGVMDDKEWREMIELLEPYVREFVFTQPSKDRAADPDELAATTDKRSTVVNEPERALEAARDCVEEDGAVLVTGSLYLAADLRDR